MNADARGSYNALHNITACERRLYVKRERGEKEKKKRDNRNAQWA